MSSNEPAKKREIYIIAHGCNSRSKVTKAIQQGVNAIECDVWVDKHQKWWVSHSGFFKTDLATWLKHIEKTEKILGTRLALIVFDIKSQESFVPARTTINELLPVTVPRVYSTSNFEKAAIFPELIPLLHANEAVAIDEEDNPAKVEAFFKRHGAIQYWYGNGISYIPINKPFHTAMQKAASIRDSRTSFSKIYVWTIHRKRALVKYLLHDKVNGVMVDLNNLFTTPVKNALDIVNAHDELVLATYNTPLQKLV